MQSTLERPSPTSRHESRATDLHARASDTYATKLEETRALLRHAQATFTPLVQASSLGAEDVVITHLVQSLDLSIPLFVLDTGALHTETLALLERTQAHARQPVLVYRPVTEQVIRFVRDKGQNAIYESIDLRKACCGIRKMEPLTRALQVQKAWITGLRREQSHARAEVSLIDESEAHANPGSSPSAGLVKINPLANWTWGDVWHYIATNNVDYNPLHDQFFPSIGCAPCTRAISLGEEFRAGRWWWEDEAAKECGLHVKK